MRKLRRKIKVNRGCSVSSVWAVPESFQPGDGRAIILAHGAGNDMHSAFIRDMHSGLARRGLLAVKFNFPYKERGQRPPDRPAVLEATWRAVYARVAGDAGLAPASVVCAGKSMGGRIASQVAAEDGVCDGLVFLGYPLHPPRRPERLRDTHWPRIRCPMLFVQGTRDPLCELELLKQRLRAVKAPATLQVVEGGDHSFNVPKRLGRDAEAVRGELLDAVVQWCRRL